MKHTERHSQAEAHWTEKYTLPSLAYYLEAHSISSDKPPASSSSNIKLFTQKQGQRISSTHSEPRCISFGGCREQLLHSPTNHHTPTQSTFFSVLEKSGRVNPSPSLPHDNGHQQIRPQPGVSELLKHQGCPELKKAYFRQKWPCWIKLRPSPYHCCPSWICHSFTLNRNSHTELLCKVVLPRRSQKGSHELIFKSSPIYLNEIRIICHQPQQLSKSGDTQTVQLGCTKQTHYLRIKVHDKTKV